jgi:hypothetical protein
MFAEGLTSAALRTNRVRRPSVAGSGETLYVAKRSLIRPLFVAEMSLLFRCSATVVPLFSRCYRPLFDRKNDAISERGGNEFKISDQNFRT